MPLIYISLGSNIDAEHHIRSGLDELAQRFDSLRLSRIYESEAVGFDGDNFLNLVAEAQTDLEVSDVVGCFKEIEADHGRRRDDKKYGSRTLDLDLLLYDDCHCQTPVELPRPEIYHHAFVLWPMAELAPLIVPPGQPHTLEYLWEQFDKSSQKLWPVSFSWPA